MKHRIFATVAAVLLLLFTFSACSAIPQLPAPLTDPSPDGTTDELTESTDAIGSLPENTLAFKRLSDRSEYSVVGIGTCTDTEIVIPSTHQGLPVTSVAADAFRGCRELLGITIPDSVTYIGSGAFADCSGLLTVSLPSTVASIESSTFEGCSSLLSITLPSSVMSIESSAFVGCTVLREITIPESVTHIGGYAFSACTALSSVKIPDSVLTVDLGAFHGCTMLSEVTIPAGIGMIGSGAFAGCSSLMTVVFTGTSEEWALVEKELDWAPPFLTEVRCSNGSVAN